MKSNYDFSSAETGKFYHPDMKLRLPVRLDEDVLTYLLAKAERDGVEVDELINGIVRRHAEDARGELAGDRYPDAMEFHHRHSMEVAERGGQYDPDRDPEDPTS
jgi:hypothetical protein